MIIAYKPTSTSQFPPNLMPSLQLNKIMEFLLLFFGRQAAIFARVFDCTSDIFDDSVFALVSLGAMVQVKLTKRA